MNAEAIAAETYWVRIYMAGDIETAKRTCRKFCESGLCVNIYSTDYIFLYGEEGGFCVELINYPRFAEPRDVILEKAWALANRLQEDCSQMSYSLMTPENTYYYSRGKKR